MMRAPAYAIASVAALAFPALADNDDVVRQRNCKFVSRINSLQSLEFWERAWKDKPGVECVRARMEEVKSGAAAEGVRKIEPSPPRPRKSNLPSWQTGSDTVNIPEVERPDAVKLSYQYWPQVPPEPMVSTDTPFGKLSCTIRSEKSRTCSIRR